MNFEWEYLDTIDNINLIVTKSSFLNMFMTFQNYLRKELHDLNWEILFEKKKYYVFKKLKILKFRKFLLR